MGQLSEYIRKRDFDETPEPEGKKRPKKSKKLRFVVQKHAARRLHYDLRLEMDGVLKSWAVPKEPSMDPADKRLAVHVEDHPLSYASFEGEIPKGNYGAGKVAIYDQGYYEPLQGKSEDDLKKQLEKGSLKFILHGKRLKGQFSLVRMNGADSTSWLFLKSKDAFSSDSKPTEPADSARAKPAPMLAKLSTGVPGAGDWIYEKKYDGFRAIAVSRKTKTDLYSRNGKSLNKHFPSVLEVLSSERSFTLDGEVVIEDRKGNSYFQLLARGEPIPPHLQLRYYVFDLLELDGHDLAEFSLNERQELLDLLLKKWADHPIITAPEHLKGSVQKIFSEAEKSGWEGIIAKRANSTYLPGTRSSAWLKIKFRKSQEAVICGYTAPQGSRIGFGALVLGIYEDEKWRYLGNCGTGFTDDTLNDLIAELEEIKVKKKPFPKAEVIANESSVSWVSPRLVCEIYFSERTAAGHFRHPVFKGLRRDKKAKEIQKETADQVELEEKTILMGKNQVKLTSLTKWYWPKEKYSKGKMLDYYESIGDLILPYLKDAPISLHRFPNGITAPGFFHKDMDLEQLPSWVKTSAIYSESSEKEVDYLICNNLETLLYIANLGSIEINPWLSTYKKMEKPVFAVLDLDPNGAAWESLIDVARSAHALFDQAGVRSYIKTSGSTGFHIYLHLGQKYDFDIARNFIQLIGEMIHEQHPDITSLTRDPKKRKGKIYLDFLQNRRGQTVVSPYSLRPKPHAPVSTPLHWEELHKELTIEQFNIQSIRQRLVDIGDPWMDIFSETADLKTALAHIQLGD